MSEQQSSYRQIMKATSIFGGVQVFQIIIQVIRSKFIAVLLGPAGMGIAGLLTSTIGLVNGLTNFGLGTSAVKDVAAANATGNDIRIATIVTVLRRWVWITGLLGTILTLFLAPWLSQLTFGNRNYTIAFIWISITLLFSQLTSGQMVILQGMRKLQYLAKANLYGSALGLIITVPLYYKFGIDGIIPAIIIASLISLSLSCFFARKIDIKHVNVSRVRTIVEGKGMLTMGVMISLSGLITVGASYIVRVFISRSGGVDQVGLYNAGFAIINTYIGLVFTAMATDYYPRLAGVAHDIEKIRTTINQQAEILLLLLTPVILIFTVFIKWVVVILYSSKFNAIDAMIHWAMLGVLFKASSWSISFLFMARGDAKIFFWNELTANAYSLILNIAGYYYYGLTGLGISFIVSYFLYLIQVYIISKFKYEFYFNKAFIKLFLFQLLIVVSCFIIVYLLLRQPYSYYVGSLIILISSIYSFRELERRMKLTQYFNKSRSN